MEKKFSNLLNDHSIYFSTDFWKYFSDETFNIYTGPSARWVECLPMTHETEVLIPDCVILKTQKKWYLICPCLTLSIIKYISKVKWSNPGKGVAPSPTPRYCSYWKRRLQLPTLLCFTYICSEDGFLKKPRTVGSLSYIKKHLNIVFFISYIYILLDLFPFF